METSRNPLLLDPLSDFSLVPLFPRTFNQLGFDPDPNTDPLEAFGAHLESLALKNANGLMEQAKMILDGGEEILNINTLGNLHGVNNVSLQRDSETVKNAGDKDLNVLARRPALGRKRPRFSLKPNSSQSTEILKPYVDIDKLEDPEEFFSAFERQENAMKELRRQTGKPLMDLDQNVLLMEEKRRRPGLLRRSASYKHRFSIAPSGGAETFLSSQETLSQDLSTPSPSNNCLQTQKIGQVSVIKERPGDVDDEIPSTPDKDDESDEIIGMLQKRFKPIEINKSCLPELNSALQSELMTVRESLHDSQDKMPDLHAIVSTIAKELPLGGNNLERRSGHPSTSPRPPKSPHSSISLLKGRLFQYRKGKDPFSNVDVDLSSAGKDGSYKDTHHLAAREFVKDSMKMQNISTVNSMIIESGYRSGESDARETNPKSSMHESELNVFNIDTQDFGSAEFTSSEKNNGGSTNSGIALNMTPGAELDNDIMPHNATVGVMEDEPSNVSDDPASKVSDAAVISVDEHMEPDHGVLEEDLAGCNIEKPHCAMGIALNMTPGAELDHEIMPHNTTDGVMEDDPSKVSEDPASKVSDSAVISVDDHMEPDHGVLEEDHEGCNVEKPHYDMDQPRANAVEDHGEDIRLSGAKDNLDHDRPSCSLAHPLKKTQKAASSKIAERDRSKTREPVERRATAAKKHKRECKEFSRRKSLAACGTQWKAGIRRSTRIRTRPLEFWKGERQLYGRIHETLVTVVGAKYFSPTKEAGQAALKVKSYVSDDYKEIVERAALH